jgi:integrase
MATFNIYQGTFTVAYLIFKGVRKTPYYQRRVPPDLVKRFGKQLIKIKLDVKQGSPASQAQRLGAYHDTLIASMRGNQDIVLPANKDAALGLLYHYGLRQGDAKIKLTALKNGGSEFGDQPHLNDFEEYYQHRAASGKLTDTDRLALQALQNPLPTMLSELWDAYVKDDRRGDRWIKKHKMYWIRFVSIVGDMPVENASIETARAYRDDRETTGVKSGTVQKEINVIKSVFNKGCRELSINTRNPFESVRATKIGQDATKRQTITSAEIKQLIAACKKDSDDIACMLLLALFTGARIGEIIGLRTKDVKLTSKVPTAISIEAYGDRNLKTSNSERIIPIHPAIRSVVKSQLNVDNSSLFPRYCDGLNKPNADSASATLNKRLKKLFTNKHVTNHCLRHTIEDRFRDADVPKDRRDEILGHAKQDSADTYGQGRSLSKKLEDLQRAMPFKL